jgi:hypothetical protein
VPSETQRAFAAAAAGVGVPKKLICRLLPGAEPGAVGEIDKGTLAKHFAAELRRGVNLASSLAAARLFRIALAGEDRLALTVLRLVLKSPDASRALGDLAGDAGPSLSFDRLTSQERHALRKLIAKATP